MSIAGWAAVESVRGSLLWLQATLGLLMQVVWFVSSNRADTSSNSSGSSTAFPSVSLHAQANGWLRWQEGRIG